MTRKPVAIDKLSSDKEMQVRGALANTEDLRVYRRATALLALHEGLSPRQVASLLGITRQTVYNWITLYGGGGEVKLTDSPRPGRPSLWDEEMQKFLSETIAQSPAHFGYGASDWTAKTLQSHLASAREIRVSTEAMRRYLRFLGYEWQNGRYVLSPGASGSAEREDSSTVSNRV